MSNADRWLQRLVNLNKAFDRLRVACDQEVYNDLELAGLIQTYEFTFELTWKTMKDKLIFEGYDVNSPRTTILQAYQVNWFTDVEVWLDALETRNLFSHAYRNEIAEEAAALIKDKFCPMLGEGVSALNAMADTA